MTGGQKDRNREIICCNEGFNVPQYTLLEKKGSEHEPIFLIKADIGKGKYSTGVGKNKKQAEQQAAKRLLEMLGEKND